MSRFAARPARRFTLWSTLTRRNWPVGTGPRPRGGVRLLRRWAASRPDARPVIVYGGDTDQPRSDIAVVSWRHLQQALDQMLSDADRSGQTLD